MDKPYQIVLDIWAGNPEIDPATLKANGVKGLIVRLNSISGTLHADSQFSTNWARAKTFDVQAIYFVYSPWATGQQNYDWLAAHLPSDHGKRRVFIDVEAVRDGYSPATYSAELKHFIGQMKVGGYALSIYSGGGSLGILSPWPKDVDYWWAGYPKALDNCESWEKYRQILETFDFKSATRLCPGTARMWQCSGDSVDNMPGFGGHAVDVNVIPGTEEDLIGWFGCKTEEIPMSNAIGLYTESPVWDNPKFDFIAGFAGYSWLETPANLKAIEQAAHAKGLPFFLWYKFSCDAYSRAQIDGNDAKWPAPEKDEILQKLIPILTNRNYEGVVIELTEEQDHNGKVEDPGYISFAAQKIMERVAAWLNYDRPGVKLIAASSNAFISRYAPNMNIWIGGYNSCACQDAKYKLVDSLPDPADKPAYLDNRATCEFWRYWNMGAKNAVTGLYPLSLLTYRMGDRAALYKWLDWKQGTTPPPPPPVVDPDLAALQQQVTALAAQVADMQLRIDKHLAK